MFRPNSELHERLTSLEDIRMNRKAIYAVLVTVLLALFGTLITPNIRADEQNKKTVMTFSQPIEIPGQILPAGTYTFKLLDSLSDRHIVQIWDADGTHLITTVLAINNVRLRPTGKTVVKFAERSGDNPEALKAWFYPGDNFGQEFVYPRQRATQLATESQNTVPAMSDESAPVDLNTQVVEVSPPTAEPAPAAVETPAPAAQPAPEPVSTPVAQPTELPKTASSLPLIALIGVTSLGLAIGLKRFSS
jgi:hypothetical protein